MYETILSPINYGGLQLKNRIIFAPTTFGLSDEEYLATHHDRPELCPCNRKPPNFAGTA